MAGEVWVLVVFACVPQMHGSRWAQEPIAECAQQQGHVVWQSELHLIEVAHTACLVE